MPSLSMWRRRRRPVDLPHPLSREPLAQDQSLLFTKLPPELRRDIFERVLCCLPIIIQQSPGKRPKTYRLKRYDAEGKDRLDSWRAIQPLNLLQTCARVYIEALDIFWAINTIETSSSKLIRQLPQLAPTRFLQRLEFAWSLTQLPPPWCPKPKRFSIGLFVCATEALPLDVHDWAKVWAALGQLRALRSLVVSLAAERRWPVFWRQYEAEVLQPLRTILATGTRGKLILNWPSNKKQPKAVETMLDQWTVERTYDEPTVVPVARPIEFVL